MATWLCHVLQHGQVWTLLAVVLLSVIMSARQSEVATATATECPWDQQHLAAWSDPNTWDTGVIPVENEKAVIGNGRHVLLDVQPAILSSLTIHANASLVWGEFDGLQLQVGYILVLGKLHIGSITCPFTRHASIKLRGRADSPHYIKTIDSVDRKVLMAGEGSIIELHGQKKTSWTRLAQTIKSLSDLPCAFIYNHANPLHNSFASERHAGLNVIAWNEEGTLFDFNVFKSFTELPLFLDSVPAGKVIGMHVCGLEYLARKEKDIIEGVIVRLGGRLILQVTARDGYSLLTRKGFPSLTKEYYKPNSRLDNKGNENFLRLPIWETKRDFQVATIATTFGQYFRVLSTDAAYPILELAEDVTGWNAGDKIVVAATDFDWQQAEIREIIDCGESCSKSQIRVSGSFRYRHYGNFTYNVDERAEVGMLTRNIVIQGEMEEECYPREGRKLCQRFGSDTFGGQMKVLKGHISVRVEGVELFHMGQQGVLCSYPLHFHLCDEAPGSWLKDNSIHHSFQRCITVHGTDKLELSGNVCYDHLGHGFFLEDSVEQNNVINRNLGLGTRHGTLLMSDSSKEWCDQDSDRKPFTVNCDEVATFWLTHPNNILTNNAAAGGEGHGFMYVFADLPLGPSFERQKQLGKVKLYSARSTAITKFYNNVAHSYKRSGIFIDSHISTGGRLDNEDGVPENGIIQEENYYEPRDPAGDPNGKRIWNCTLERTTAYKNWQNNMWIKGGNINVTFSSLADAASQSFSGGCTGFWTGVSVEYSILIGRTDNLGDPSLYKEVVDKTTLTHQFERSYGKSPWQTVTGIGIYQGPMYVKHSYFDRFITQYWNDSWTPVLGKRPVSNAGAISFKKDSTYPTYTSQYTTNLTFGYCDNINNGHWLFFGEPSVYDWEDKDGTRNAHNMDLDGSLTGVPNIYIVRNRPFFTGPECLYRPDWGMSVCPYRYVKIEVVGEGGNLDVDKKTHWALIAYRDDAPEDPFFQEGKQRREYLARTYTSFLLDFNTTMKGARFPDEVKVMGYGVETQDLVRVGLCMPEGLTKFDIVSTYPVVIRRNNYTRATSLADLDTNADKSAVYYDTDNGIIFFNVWSLHDRTNDSQLCSAGFCFNFKILLHNGNKAKMRTCFGAHYQPYIDTRPRSAKLSKPDPCFRLGSPEGLGAVRWNEVRKIVHHDFNIPCENIGQVPGFNGPDLPTPYKAIKLTRRVCGKLEKKRRRLEGGEGRRDKKKQKLKIKLLVGHNNKHVLVEPASNPLKDKILIPTLSINDQGSLAPMSIASVAAVCIKARSLSRLLGLTQDAGRTE